MIETNGKAKILIIADEVIIAADLQSRLKNLGYTVCGQATTGEKALKLVGQHQPDLVMMDIVLQGEMDGIDAAEVIWEKTGIPVVFLIDHSDMDRLKRAKLTYPFRYLLKPFQNRDFQIALDMALLMAKKDAERKKTEEALRTELRTLSTLVDGLSATKIGVDIVGLDYCIIYQNQLIKDRFGNAEGKICYETYLGLTEPCDPCPMRQSSASGQIERIELHGKDGRYYEILAAPLPNKDGAVDKAIEIIVDITDRKLSETALKESEEFLRAIVENIPDMIFVKDAKELRFVRFNKAGEKLLGFSREELIGKNDYDFFPKEEADFFTEKDRDVLSSGEHLDIPEEPIQTKYRGERILHTKKMPILDEEGRPQYLLGISEDITERKDAEKAHFEALARFYGFAEASQYGMGMADLDGHIVYVNSTLARMLGEKSPDDCLGKHFPTAYYSSLMARKLQEEVMPALMRDGYWHGELELLTTDHRCVPTDENYFVIRDENGSPCYLADILTDITERKQAEKALRESEERYRLLVQHAPAGIYEFEMETMKFISVNDVMCEYTGYTRDEFLALNPWELIADESKETLNRLLEEVFAGNPNPAPVEYKIRGKNNREFWILVTSRFSFENDAPKKATAVVHDLTDIRQAQEERKQLEAQLHQAHKMEAVGTLAGGVAHDFNNLLQAISGYTQILLLNKGQDDSEYSSLKAIEKSSERAAQLVKQLLLFSRKAETDRKPLNLNQEIEHARRILERTIPKMIDIKVHTGDRLWPIIADPIQVEQILFNLGTNSADAMPDGGKLIIETANITLDDDYTHNHLGAQPGPYVLLTVSDTGLGMDKETVEHIFEPFYTTKEIGKGTGLGLASVYGIVKSHGGYITCYSEFGQGTIFKIYLPAMEQQVAEEEKDIIAKPPKSGDETILLVDDEESIRGFGQQALLNFGYRVLTASSGEEALEVYSINPDKIDLVILDISMPGMGGHRCLQELLQIDSAAKVIIASGYSINGQVKKTLEAGAMGYVGKPYQLNNLLNKVREILDEKK